MSAVVLPTSISSASGCALATAIAVATQLAAATSHGRARAAARTRARRRRQHAQRRVAERVLRRVEHEADALALGPERVGELGGHRHRDARRRPGGHLGDDSRAPRPAPRGRARPRTAARPSAARAVAARRALVLAPPTSSRSRMPMRAVAGMRVVGVIDLKGGVGGARRARRARTLRPVRGAWPTAASRSRSRARFRTRSGSKSSTSPTSTRSRAARGTPDASRALAREARVMVDAGVSEPARGAGAARRSARSASSSGPRR